MRCPSAEGCPLYPLFRLGSSLRVWREDYCAGVFQACARFQLSRAGAPVAPTLLPNGREPDLASLHPRGACGAATAS